MLKFIGSGCNNYNFEIYKDENNDYYAFERGRMIPIEYLGGSKTKAYCDYFIEELEEGYSVYNEYNSFLYYLTDLIEEILDEYNELPNGKTKDKILNDVAWSIVEEEANLVNIDEIRATIKEYVNERRYK